MSSKAISEGSPNPSPGAAVLFARLTRIQFIPLVILPSLVGTTLAYSLSHRLNCSFLVLVVLGVVLLHLGANGIDDCYDYENGVDVVANSMFPKDFGGWKPIPRGFVTLKTAKIISFMLFGFSLAIGAIFWRLVGPWAFFLALGGFLLALFYSAPPPKLDYRGLGLGELSIFFCFGPIPVLGAFYVQTGYLSLNVLLISVPVGLLTVTVLLDHDLIFYEVYSKARKFSLGAVLGRKNTLKISLGLTLFAYLLVVALVALRVLPLWSLLAPAISGAFLSRKGSTFARPNEPPPHYLPFTVNAMMANWIFSLILALSILL